MRPGDLLPSVTSDSPPPPYDCRSCGACCFSPWSGHGYVVVDEQDLARLRRRGVATVTLRYGGAYESGTLVEKLATRRDEAGHFVCAQLDGPPGGPCACRIYEDRPAPCRRLEPGSAPCLDARRRLGLPV
jgi:uncharacterized protein